MTACNRTLVLPAFPHTTSRGQRVLGVPGQVQRRETTRPHTLGLAEHGSGGSAGARPTWSSPLSTSSSAAAPGRVAWLRTLETRAAGRHPCARDKPCRSTSATFLAELEAHPTRRRQKGLSAGVPLPSRSRIGQHLLDRVQHHRRSGPAPVHDTCVAAPPRRTALPGRPAPVRRSLRASPSTTSRRTGAPSAWLAMRCRSPCPERRAISMRPSRAGSAHCRLSRSHPFHHRLHPLEPSRAGSSPAAWGSPPTRTDLPPGRLRTTKRARSSSDLRARCRGCSGRPPP